MSAPYCPFCSISCAVVGEGIQQVTGMVVTAIHCNRCDRTIRLLGVRF